MKIKALPETEVYADDGHICVRQKDATGEPDNVVYFPPEVCVLIADKMKALAQELGIPDTRSSV